MFTNQNLLNNNLRRIFILFVISLFFVSSIIAQNVSSVDLSFDTALSRNQAPSLFAAANVVIQPDGKILLFGNFNNVNAKSINKIARLNSDGTVDNSFFCSCEGFQSINSAVVQPDGKIVIGGDFYGRRLARLNSDGSIDGSFNAVLDSVVYSVTVWAVQPDGKVIASTLQPNSINVFTVVRRFNTDGSVDNSFSPVTFSGFQNEFLYMVKLLPDGKILISGKHSFGNIFRVNSDGTRDTSFEAPVFTGAITYITDFGVQSTGKIVIIGSWDTINGLNRPTFARLNTDGSVDTKFMGGVQTGERLAILSGDRILVEGSVRLNANGTPDNTYSPAYTFTKWAVDSLERVVFIGTFVENAETNTRIGRMNADGSSDGTFNFGIVGVSGEATALAVQPDGKILIAGFFNRVNGVQRKDFTRVNSNGSTDLGFNLGSVLVSGSVFFREIVVQPDGKILVDKERFNSDGSFDASYNPTIDNEVLSVALQPDGKILLGGNFTSVNGSSRSGLARLNSNGSLDASFNPMLGNASIYALLVQADGKIMVGGTFSGINGFNRSNLSRLNADGSLDTSFNAGSIGSILQVERLSDGKYFVISNGALLRRNSDGTADASFPAPATQLNGSSNGFIRRFLVQPDGNIVIGGEFTKVNSSFRNNITRLRPNGRVDLLFFPKGANGRINDIIAQPDGKLIVGGDFSTFENVPRSGVARLTPAPFRLVTMFDYDGDGKADISVFRPSENKWYVLRSSDSGVTQQVFAISGDVTVPADYDGDGTTDFAIFRPSSNDWWSLYSSNNVQAYAHWGQNGAIPRPSDFDGDGRADYIYFLPSNSTWYRYGSNSPVSVVTFGLTGDKPVTGDFDGDGKTDVAIFRPSTGDWWWQSSVDNVQRATHWGISTDLPAPADYDGDGKTDFAVFRPSEGNWYVFNSSDFSYTILHWGIAEDKPVAADYDGDGRADIAVFRPSTGVWYLLQSTAGFTELPFGVSTDIPTPNSFVP
jgi:uncharacterized delta-60 repeat protein